MVSKKSASVIEEGARLFAPALKRLAGLEYKSFAIVGMGWSNIMFNQDFESGNEKPASVVLAINSAAVWFRNVDMAIAMDDLRRDKHTHPGYVEALTTLPIPLLTTDHYEEYPNSVAYPLAAVVKTVFKGSKWLAQKNLQNTVNYAVAFAILEGASLIKMYGCDFTRQDDPRLLTSAFPNRKWLPDPDPDWFKYHDKEVVRHRAAGEPGEAATNFLLGLAFERGIDIWICDHSSLMDNDRLDHFYGYGTQPPL